MNVGWAPRNCTLYGVESLRIRSLASEASIRSSVSRAASLSSENAHSYGYEMNGMLSWRRTPAHLPRRSPGASAPPPGGVRGDLGATALLGAHEPPVARERLVEPGLDQLVPVGQAARRQGPV